jgi:hypothetical protein
MQHQGGRSRRHNGVVNAKVTVDLIIVPPWNQSAEALLKAIFVFVEDYL